MDKQKVLALIEEISHAALLMEFDAQENHIGRVKNFIPGLKKNISDLEAELMD